jgi:uncharacterized protein (TIGR04255 family)
MAQQQQLRKPPIVEASIDIRVSPKSGITADIFSDLIESQKSLFQIEHQIEMSFQIPLTEAPPEVLPRTRSGVVLRDDQKGIFVQLQISGFSFSRTKGYTHWDSLKEEASGFWKTYKRISSPEKITRLSTRYVNAIKFPYPLESITQVLTAPIILPPNVPNSIAAFQTSATIVDEQQELFATVSQIMNNVSNPKFLSMILDITTFQQKEYAIDDNNIWILLEKMRELKNRIFFESLTEQTIQSYL